jgi:O-methyltransferase
MTLRDLINGVFRPFGCELARIRDHPEFPGDFAPEDLEIIRAVRPYTMAKTVDKIFHIISAARYITRRNLPGAIVECGVWRGGMMMAAAHALLRSNDRSRELYLFDTFEGMAEPTEKDTDIRGKKAITRYRESERTATGGVDWCYASLPEVQRNVESTDYPKDKLHFVKGRVEETLPAQAPNAIAILRLDTDWYSSSKHELDHLFPRLVQGGVLILDDYGFWKGCREATDEYFAAHKVQMHLIRVDEATRVGIKL